MTGAAPKNGPGMGLATPEPFLRAGSERNDLKTGKKWQ